MWQGTETREALLAISASDPRLRAVIAILDAHDTHRIAWDAYSSATGPYESSPLEELNACLYLLQQAEEVCADDDSQLQAAALARDAVEHAKAALRIIDAATAAAFNYLRLACKRHARDATETK
jgi:hypothetical protein